ncbi:MAG: ABC-F family ATP-binding cassette domain-containing protein [Blautia sp.]|nr:ABC-F family ATP-binding cassette domain-containing protein [Blautia sp.]
MNILTLENIGKTQGNKILFENVNTGIDEQDRIGVIGVNGTGKSTLLSIIAGEAEPDTGSVVTRSGLRISFLRQNPVFDPDRSVLENVANIVQGHEAHWNVEGEARAMLEKLGISDPDGPVDVLSGGQRKKAALAAALLTPCDLLILDEPTNHLDHDMIEWLQSWLESYPHALLMVTHDRYFLDEVTGVIWEIDRHSIYRYEGNYEAYLQKKQERLDFAKAAERKMAALYKQDLAWMMRGARARSTKQKAHIQRFEALRDREKLIEERNVAIASLPTRMGNKTIEMENVSKSYGDKLLFRDFTYSFIRTDRIGIIGPNGCGKSTLVKMILGQIPADTGRIDIGQTIVFGYFGQENEALDESLRVIDYVREGAEFIRTEEGLVSASNMCERFLFDKDQQYTLVSKLSGGEKRRLYLLRVLMQAPNVLILDEPTNDLDIQTLQVLEDYLDHFAGIIVAVSHDRYFLDRVVTRIFSFEGDGKLTQSEGGYEEYLEHRRERVENAKAEKESTQAGDGAVKKGRGGKPRQERKKTRLSYTEQREYDTLEARVDELTRQSEELQRQMDEAATSYMRLQELSEQKEQVDQELDESILRFLELQEMVEGFES